MAVGWLVWAAGGVGAKECQQSRALVVSGFGVEDEGPVVGLVGGPVEHLADIGVFDFPFVGDPSARRPLLPEVDPVGGDVLFPLDVAGIDGMCSHAVKHGIRPGGGAHWSAAGSRDADGNHLGKQGGVEVVEHQVCFGGAGEVDGVAARVLVIATVVGGDRGVEAPDGLAGATAGPSPWDQHGKAVWAVVQAYPARHGDTARS